MIGPQFATREVFWIYLYLFLTAVSGRPIMCKQIPEAQIETFTRSKTHTIIIVAAASADGPSCGWNESTMSRGQSPAQRGVTDRV